jgi:ferrous iron transport protein A
VAARESERGHAREDHRALADCRVGETVVVTRVDLEPELRGWLGGVGIVEGEELTLLRRAMLGGPLHVRLAEGGELAVARDVAAHIVVRSAP